MKTYKRGVRVMKRLRRTAFVLTLWLMFSIGCFCAPLFVIAYPYCKRNGYMQNFIKAADRMCASLLGFTGRHMLSTELIHENRLLWMKNALDEIQHKHCEESAVEEGAYCRIKDRRLGDK